MMKMTTMIFFLMACLMAAVDVMGFHMKDFMAQKRKDHEKSMAEHAKVAPPTKAGSRSSDQSQVKIGVQITNKKMKHDKAAKAAQKAGDKARANAAHGGVHVTKSREHKDK